MMPEEEQPSAPNGVRDLENARRILGTLSEETLPIVLSLGYPAHPHTPREDDVEGILRRIKRKPLDELVTWVD